MKQLSLIIAFLFVGTAVMAQMGTHYGEKITSKGAISVKKLRSKMAKKEELNCKVIAKIDEACVKKGCWMTLVDESTGKNIRVTFKDYGFFVPVDCHGDRTVIEGKAYYKVTTVADLRHYAEDAGKSKEEIMKITEDKSELVFEATGVIIFS